MKSPLLLCAFLFGTAVPSPGQATPALPKGLFDFSDLDVKDKDDEKKAKELAKEQELEAAQSLPEQVRRILDRLTVFELVETSVLGKKLQPMRRVVQDKLIGIADDQPEPAKSACIGLSKQIEEQPLEEALPADGAATHASEDVLWETKGRPWALFHASGYMNDTAGEWYAVNRRRTIFVADWYGGPHADVLILASPAATEAEVFNVDGSRFRAKRAKASGAPRPAPVLPTVALKLLKESAKSEAALRIASASAVAEKRTKVSRWLVEEAKAAAPAAAKEMLAIAASFNAPKGGKQLERASRLAGVWRDGTQTLEFRPDGAVLVNGRPGKLTWTWAKARNWGTFLVLTGDPAEPSDIWSVRLSSKDPTTLRITTRDNHRLAKRE